MFCIMPNTINCTNGLKALKDGHPGYTLIESSNQSLAYFKSRQYLRFINDIRPNRLDTEREHVISGGINIRNQVKFVFVLWC